MSGAAVNTGESYKIVEKWAGSDFFEGWNFYTAECVFAFVYKSIWRACRCRWDCGAQSVCSRTYLTPRLG